MSVVRTLLVLLSFPSCLWANTTIVRARVAQQASGMTTYNLSFCTPGSSALGTLRRFTVEGNLKNFPLEANGTDECVTTTDEFPMTKGWRVVCYKFFSSGKTEILKLLLNPADGTFTSGFDSRELEGIPLNKLAPFANDTGAESQMCENFTS